MVERLKSKQEIRAEMEKEIAAYLESGGHINHIKQGISGRDDNRNLQQSISFTPSAPQSRTLVNDTIKAIDERKKKKTPETKAAPKKARKKIIYDDFGEPIREVWE